MLHSLHSKTCCFEYAIYSSAFEWVPRCFRSVLSSRKYFGHPTQSHLYGFSLKETTESHGHAIIPWKWNFIDIPRVDHMMPLQIVTAAKYSIAHRTNVRSFVSLQPRYACIPDHNVFGLVLNFLFAALRTFRRIVGHRRFAVADHAFEILVVNVHLAVFLQVTKLSESFIADITTVRTLTRMYHHVPLQIVTAVIVFKVDQSKIKM